jgi:adenylate cyclase
LAAGGTLWRTRLRIWSGVVLFAFALTHLLNHALGLISLELMDEVRDYRIALWRSLAGTILLYGALALHIVLALYRTARQRTWRMSLWQAVQLCFGLAIPLLLFRHIIGTRMAHQLFGVNDSYIDYALWVMWPGEAWNQLFLITVVWVHGTIGLHFWLRLKPLYRRLQWALYAGALLVPILAYAGFAVAGRNVRLLYEFKNPFTRGQLAELGALMEYALWAVLAIIALIFAFRLIRMIVDKIRPQIKITYAGSRTVVSEIGPSLLEISRTYGITHASVCGGRARCSTCRVRVLEGAEHLPEPDLAERRVLERIGAGPNIRLACQMAPQADLTLARLLPAKETGPEDVSIQDKYAWGVEQDVTIMFVDIRGFTTLSEKRLPFDVVFLLNQFHEQMGAAIETAGGYVDKFLGDGIMAIFGIESSTSRGAREALTAARQMGVRLDDLNETLASDLPDRLNIGIGIHTGPVILGRVGDAGRSGSTQRITALGDTVNTASRLEAASKDLAAELVISAETANAADIGLAKKRTRKVKIRGKQIEVAVHVIKHAKSAPIATPAG